jgi:Transmembrane amino acid transporter protein
LISPIKKSVKSLIEEIKIGEADEHLEKDKDLGILAWILSKFRPGSEKGTIFNLLSATIGAGVLSLPSAVAQSGLGIGMFLIVFGGVLGFFSTYILVAPSHSHS